MKSKVKTLIVLFILPFMLQSQEISFPENGYWQIGFGLGELPTGGSFKPSISVGYHFNEKIYAGIIYQLKDHIARNQASINARSSRLTGLKTASEIVAHRFLAQIRYKPFRNGPYLSTGIVFNGETGKPWYLIIVTDSCLEKNIPETSELSNQDRLAGAWQQEWDMNTGLKTESRQDSNGLRHGDSIPSRNMNSVVEPAFLPIQRNHCRI